MDDPMKNFYADPRYREVLVRVDAFDNSQTAEDAAADSASNIGGMLNLLVHVAGECLTEYNALSDLQSQLGRLGPRASKRAVRRIETEMILLIESEPLVKAAYEVATMTPFLVTLSNNIEILHQRALRGDLTPAERTELPKLEEFREELEASIRQESARLRVRPS